jgi:hypothetical protein
VTFYDLISVFQSFFPDVMKISLALALILLESFNVGCAAEARPNTQTIYFTVGDSQDLLWTPLESKIGTRSELTAGLFLKPIKP